MSIKLLKRDQYSRAVARVEYGGWLKRDLGEELLKEGLAVVYKQGGAAYDGRYEKYVGLEAKARQRRLGLWSQLQKDLELPSQYKANAKKKAGVGVAAARR